MKNITVSVDDDTYHRARIRAAEQRTSVSAVVREALQEYSAKETAFERALKEERKLVERINAGDRGLDPAENLPRADLYDRHALR